MKIELKPIILLLLILFSTSNSQAQEAKDTIAWNQKPTIEFSGFVDIFYAYDFNQPTGNIRQPFLYNHNRQNEFNLNVGFLKIAVKNPQYRANLALQAGTYAQDNYAAEPSMLRTIFEANVGISISKKNRLWLDAGIFSSHIGFESAISSDNWTLTRSILAENSPYYLSGAKLTFQPNSKWEMAALVLNGWQRIQRLPGNSIPSFGTQLKFAPSKKITLNWSTFIGTDDPDSLRRMRYFNNFYGQLQLSKRIGLIAGFDVGFQQKTKNTNQYNSWYSPVLIAQFKLTNTWKTALRAEYYDDQKNTLVSAGKNKGFQVYGLSWNFDFSPAENITWRLEARHFSSSKEVFSSKSGLLRSDFFLCTSLAIKF
ncbi:MAG: porin [Crocinitomicaceae bacterium]